MPKMEGANDKAEISNRAPTISNWEENMEMLESKNDFCLGLLVKILWALIDTYHERVDIRVTGGYCFESVL